GERELLKANGLCIYRVVSDPAPAARRHCPHYVRSRRKYAEKPRIIKSKDNKLVFGLDRRVKKDKRAITRCLGSRDVDVQPAANRVYGMTPGRLGSTIDAVVGLVSAILAGWALARSAGRIGNGGRNGAIVAMVVGLIVIAYAVLHLNLFTGDFGTGRRRARA